MVSVAPRLGSFPGGRERAPGVWEVRASTGVADDRGRYRQVSRTVHGGRRLAQDALRELRNEIAAGTHDRKPTGPVTVRNLIARWQDAHRLDWAPATRRSNESHARRLIAAHLGDVILERLTAERIEGWHRQLLTTGADPTKPRALSPTTVRTAHRLLQAAITDAMRWGLVDRNVAALARQPRAFPPRRAAFTIGDIGKVIELTEQLDDAGRQTDPRMATLIRTAAATGARRGELVALRWSDIDLKAGIVSITAALTADAGELVRKPTKTGNERLVAIDPVTVATLKAWRKATAATFLKMGWPLTPDTPVWRQRASRTPMYPDTVSQLWRDYADAAGLIGVRFHDIRHAVASTLVNSGRDARSVADRLGHANPSMTLNVYTHAVGSSSQADADYLAGLLKGGAATGPS